MTAGLPRIKTPIVQRWHRFRLQVLPILFFVFTIGITLWLWDRQARRGNSIAAVEIQRVDVTSPSSGRLIALSKVRDGQQVPLEQFDRVTAGEVIGRFDDTLLRKRLETLQAQLSVARSQVFAAGAQMAQDLMTERNQYQQNKADHAVRKSQLQIDILNYDIAISVNRIEVKRIDSLRESRIKLNEGRTEPYVPLEEIRQLNFEKQKAQETIESNQRAKQDALAELKTLGEFPEGPSTETWRKTWIKVREPLEKQLAVWQAEIAEIDAQIETLEVVAPIDGTVALIYGAVDQNIQAGAPIVTIASDEGRYLVAYIRRRQRLRATEGMKVTIRTRHPGSAPVEAIVQTVGSQVEPVPAHQLNDPGKPEWGVPVRLSMPESLSLRPGEIVDVIFPLAQREG